MPSRLLPCLAASLLAGLVAGCTALSQGFAPASVSLATGTPGAAYHPVGNAICRMFNETAEGQARPCIAYSSGGSVENIRRVESGASTFGIAQADVADAALRGVGPFAAAGPYPKLRVLLALHTEALTVVARADAGIRDFQDLRGKRVGVGKSDAAGYPFTRDAVLAAYGWTLSDFTRVQEVDPAGQERALCGNEVDAVFFAVGHPNGVTQDLTANCRGRLVRVAGQPIEQLLATQPAYVAFVIPGGLYAGNPDAVPTLGLRAVLVASSELPDAVAYALVKAVCEDFADFRRMHPVLANLEPKDMVPAGSGIAIHPGALNYYREAHLVP
jgi:TRAP transporter TAXI family solute receptor